MNAKELALLVVILAAGGVTIAKLEPKGDPIPIAKAASGESVLIVDPPADQCPVLLQGGGDRLGSEIPITDRPEHEAARALTELLRSGAVTLAHFDTGLQAGDDRVSCRGTIFLSAPQADRAKDDDDVRGHLELLGTPVTGVTPKIELAGGTKAESFVIADDLAVKE